MSKLLDRTVFEGEIGIPVVDTCVVSSLYRPLPDWGRKAVGFQLIYCGDNYFEIIGRIYTR